MTEDQFVWYTYHGTILQFYKFRFLYDVLKGISTLSIACLDSRPCLIKLVVLGPLAAFGLGLFFTRKARRNRSVRCQKEKIAILCCYGMSAGKNDRKKVQKKGTALSPGCVCVFFLRTETLLYVPEKTCPTVGGGPSKARETHVDTT